MNLKIPHNAFVFVGDGRKALFLRNDGDEKFPYLKTERVFVDENLSSHEQGTERPGRVSKASQTGGRSAVEPTDWHELEEQHFVRMVAAAMERLIRAQGEVADRRGSATGPRGTAARVPPGRKGLHSSGDKQGPDQASGWRNREASNRRYCV